MSVSSRRIQFQRGTTAQNAVFDGLVGELTVDTDKRAVVLHDGTGGLTTMVTETTSQTLENKTLSLDDNSFPGIDGSGLEVVGGELQLDETAVRTSGNQTISGLKTFTETVAVNNPGGLTTNQTTINLFNGAADTINFGQNATNIQIAANTGTTSINNNLFVDGSFTVAGDFFAVDQENLVVENKNIFLGEISEPSDALADGGGVILRGDEDKSLLWIQGNDAWTSSENFDLAENKSYLINGSEVLTDTTLGSSVVSSSLESVGTITTGTWNGDVISSEHGGTGHSTFSDGELLIGNTGDDTLNKSTLDGGLGININNGPGVIEIVNSDRGSAQNIFKNVSNQSGVPQFSASTNNDSIRFEGVGGTEITFDSETNTVLIESEAAPDIITAGDGIDLSITDGEVSVDNTVVRTFGEQEISGTKTFTVPIDGDISGNAASASRLEPGAFINGVFFDGTENINLIQELSRRASFLETVSDRPDRSTVRLSVRSLIPTRARIRTYSRTFRMKAGLHSSLPAITQTSYDSLPVMGSILKMTSSLLMIRWFVQQTSIRRSTVPRLSLILLNLVLRERLLVRRFAVNERSQPVMVSRVVEHLLRIVQSR